MKTILTITAGALLALVCGCNAGEGKVKFHFEPPMSYHTVTFSPLSLAEPVTKTYSTPKFFKIDKRFSGVRANLFVESSQNAMTIQEATNILAGAIVSIVIREPSGNVLLTNTLQLVSLQCRIMQKEPLLLNFGFPPGPFTPKENMLGSIDLNITTPNNTNGAEAFTIFLKLEELVSK